MLLGFEKCDQRSGHETGRKLLQTLYEQYTGEQMPPVLVAEGGKPYFADGSVHFSISHTKAHAFCVLSRSPVGLDAEEMDRRVDLRLAEKILSPAEKERFDRRSDRRAALLKLWVLKEAAAKLSGRGLQGYPNHTDFDPDDPRVREIDGCYVAILE